MKDQNTRIGIVGAGPGGISMAKILAEKGYKNVTIFEKEKEIGGKSWSVAHEGLVHELGTCYAALGYGQAFKWMKETGVRKINNEPAFIAGKKYHTYAYGGKSKWAALQEFLRYRKYWQKFHKGQIPPEVYSLPTLEWLQANRFDILIRSMHRGMTAMGYGFLEEVPLYHTFQWVNPAMIITGAINAVYEPVQGWQTLWQRLAEPMQVYLDCEVEGVVRGNAKPQLLTKHGTFEFDEIILTLPLSDAGNMLEFTKEEQTVVDAIRWGALKTNLVVTREWYQDESIRVYKPQVASRATAKMGHLMAVRRTSTQKLPNNSYGNITPGYVCYQMAESHSSEALRKLLHEDLSKEGVKNYQIVAERKWRYMPFFKTEALQNGIVNTLKNMQGKDHCWYSGCVFSHESIRNIVEFNKQLVVQMLK